MTILIINCCLSTTFLFSQTVINSESFETGWGIWNDGGDDCTRDPNSRLTGAYSINLQDNSVVASAMTSNSIDLTPYGSIDISFDFMAVGMETGEDFWLRYSSDGGTNWITIATYVRGTDFSNDTKYARIVNLNITDFTFSVNSKFRIQCDASENDDDVYIDSVVIVGRVPGPEIDILGNGNSIINGDITPNNYDNTDFGSIGLGASLVRTFTIQNTGTANLTVSGIVLSNTTDFSITGVPFTSPIASAGSTTFTVTFNSATIGTKTSTLTISNNDTDEATYQFTIEANTQQNFFDSDGDGIFDNIDIDDDNDGIKDTDEETDCRNSLLATTVDYKFLNETYGTGLRTTINTTYDATTTYCYEDGNTSNQNNCTDNSDYSLNDGEYTVGVSAQIATWASQYWYMGVDHTGDANGRMAMFNASYEPGIFYTATIMGALPNIPITYSFWVLNLDRTDAPDIANRLRPNILVEFRDIGNNVLASITTGDISPTTNGNLAGDWYNFTADLTFSVDEFYVYFINNETGGLGNDLAIDDIEITQTLCDTDNDGVADVFDLDSDNDGIPDVVEAGLGQLSSGIAKIPHTVGWIDANGNGMHDAAESNSALDTDGDSVPNYLDLDSDNDAIFDVDESGAGNSGDVNYQNGDGDINGDGVGDGLDSDAVREKDFNSDGTSEYFTDGILDIYDYYNGGVFNTAYGNINQGLGNTYFIKDTDNDGIPDYMDTISNGVTFDIFNTLYASLDANNDGIIDGNTDIDHDGIIDNFDTNTAAFGSPRDLDRKLHLYFDGRNDYGDDTSAVLSGLNEATLMGWVKIDASATDDEFLFGQNNFYLQLNANKTVKVTGSGNTVSSSIALATNQWIHLAATYSSSNSKLKLYLNGQIIDSTNVSGALAVDASSFSIGRKPDTNSNYYQGFFDEIRVFEKALTANELHKMVYQEIQDNSGNVSGAVIPRDITNYINTTTTPIVLPWSNLKRYYRMDVYKDDIIDDLTTETIDVGSGTQIYNMKIIEVQNAPLPFVTQLSGSLPVSVDILANGVKGTDAITYDWSIVDVKHDIIYNANQKHLGLIVENPNKFSIENNTELNVTWYLRLDGFIDLEGESQLVQGDDSILDENSGGYIERDQQGTANSFNYNYWASSVGPIGTGVGSNNANYAISGILKDGTNATSPGVINFKPDYYAADAGVTSPIIISSYWLYKFNGPNNDYNAWFPRINEFSTIKAGEGYTMKGTSGAVNIANQQNYVFKGKPNNGDITLAIAKGNDRLIGNPYASAMDADEFIKDNIKETINSKIGRNANNIFNGALYFWDHFGEINTHILREYVGGYATYNLIGGAKAISNDYRINANFAEGNKIPTKYIPVGQGFFVVTSLDPLTGTTTSIDGGDIVFKNSQRIFITEAFGNSVFMKGVNAKSKSKHGDKETAIKKNKVDNRPKIWLQFNSPTGYQRQLLVGVDDNASTHFDLGYDAPIADLSKEDMYWTFDSGKFVIQGVNNFDNKQVLPLGIVISKAGLVSIKIDKTENLAKNIQVYLKDKLTGISKEIDKSTFEIILEAGEYLDRFYISFQRAKLKQDQDYDADDPNIVNSIKIDENVYNNQIISQTDIKEAILIYMNNAISELQITKPVEAEIVTVNLYNYLGQNIKTWNTNLNAHFLSLPVNTTAGAYIVQIITSCGSVDQKVIVE